MDLRRMLTAVVVVAWGMMPAGAAPAAELVYYHAQGCGYCAQWEEEILPIYHKTDEGRRLPLRPIDAAEAWPADLAAVTPGSVTPTFIVVNDAGREVGRIPGYRADFFWPFLGALIARMDPPVKP